MTALFHLQSLNDVLLLLARGVSAPNRDLLHGISFGGVKSFDFVAQREMHP